MCAVRMRDREECKSASCSSCRGKVKHACKHDDLVCLSVSVYLPLICLLPASTPVCSSPFPAKDVREGVPELLLGGVERRGIGDGSFHRVRGERALGLGDLGKRRKARDNGGVKTRA